MPLFFIEGENMKREFIFLGPPACGKGTQTNTLSEYLKLPHIDTGSLLRAEIKNETEAGKEAKSYIDKGLLVPVELVTRIIKNRLSQDDCKNGYVLDGFPRTIPQAEALQAAGIPIDFVLEIAVPDEEIVTRMSGRRVDPVSGRTYHIKYNPPKVEGKDDITGDPLIQRDDDKEEVVLKRLSVYHAQTEALVKFYGDLAASGDASAPKYRSISGLGTIEEIKNRVFEALK